MGFAGHPRQSGGVRGLEIELAHMGGLVESQLNEAINAFERRDIATAERVISADARIDDQHHAVDKKVMELLAAGPFPQPVVREIMTHMKVAGDLERIGDLAKNLAKRTLVVSREQPAPIYPAVARMGRASLQRVTDVLTAYSTRNVEGANAVWGGDDQLDELYNSLFQDILQSMMADTRLVNACTQLVFIAKNFERIGDHATNIAEALLFLVTGTTPAGERPKNDETSVTVVRAPEPR